MDGEKFDDLLKKVCTTRLTRLGVVRGLAVGAMAAVTGSAFVADDAVAGKKSKKARRKKRAARERHLGDACRVDGDCASGEHLFCDQVGETGARRCECVSGFTACDGVCLSLTPTSSDPAGCVVDLSPGVCACVCPVDELGRTRRARCRRQAPKSA